jgi:hypothetical protein
MAKDTGKENEAIRGVNIEHGESALLVARPSIAAVWYRYLLTLGLYHFWRKRNVAILTDRRVLTGKGLLNRTERSIPIARINDAVYQRKGLYAYCEIASTMRGRQHVLRVGPISPRMARKLTDQIQLNT